MKKPSYEFSKFDCNNLAAMMASEDEIRDGKVWSNTYYFIADSKKDGERLQDALRAIGLNSGELIEDPINSDEWIVSITVNAKPFTDMNAFVLYLFGFAAEHGAYLDT